MSKELNYEYDFPYSTSTIVPRAQSENSDDKIGDSHWWDRGAIPGAYSIRGPNYLQDQIKVPSVPSCMELVGSTFTFNREPVRNISSAPGHVIAEQHVGRADRPFMLVTNFLVPQIGNWVCYFAPRRGQAKDEVFERMLKNFVEGTDEYRNKRFKIIPGIPNGGFVVRNTVGNKPAILGTKIATKYYVGDNFMEIEVDVGTSTVALGVMSVVAGYASSLDIELAFLFESQDPSELPERMIGGICVRKPLLTPPWWNEVSFFG